MFYSLIYKKFIFFSSGTSFFNFWEVAASISGFSLRECVGQTLIQRIQEIHLSLSVCLGLSDGIAPDGHFAAHNPQEPQVCEAPGISGIVPYSRRACYPEHVLVENQFYSVVCFLYLLCKGSEFCKIILIRSSSCKLMHDGMFCDSRNSCLAGEVLSIRVSSSSINVSS